MKSKTDRNKIKSEPKLQYLSAAGFCDHFAVFKLHFSKAMILFINKRQKNEEN